MKRFITIIIFLICFNLSLPSFASDTSAKTYCDSGLTKIELKDYKGALEDYTKAIQLEPNNYDAYLGRGKVGRLLKDYNNSIKDYTKAIELNSYNYKGYTGRGISKFELKDYTGSIEDCTKAIEINPNYYWAYLYRSHSKNELKDFKGAEQDSKMLEKAIEDFQGAEQDRKKFDESTKYFKNYMEEITKIIQSNWEPPVKEPGTSIITLYTLNKKGEISNIMIIKSSHIIQNDESAINALNKSSPLPPLPSEFKGSSIDIEFHFDIKPKM